MRKRYTTYLLDGPVSYEHAKRNAEEAYAKVPFDKYLALCDQAECAERLEGEPREARAKALEEAAQLCENESLAWHVSDPNSSGDSAAANCARYIRELLTNPFPDPAAVSGEGGEQ